MKKKRKKEKKSEFRETLDFVAESKIYFFVAIVLFLITIIIGFVFPVFFVDYIIKVIEQLALQTEKMNFIQLFIFIFSNNLKTAFIGVFSGILVGIIPLVILLFNGYVLGFVGNKVVASSGFLVLWRLLPHGVFEIPALILSLGLGLRLGMFLLSAKEKKKGILAFFISLSCFLVICFIIFSLVLLLSPFKTPDNLTNIQLNPLVYLFPLVFLALVFIISNIVGMKVLSINDRRLVLKNLKERFENSFRVFVYLIIPLLIIAAIIETALIIFLK